MMVVSVETEPTFAAQPPRLLFEGSFASSFRGLTSNYDVTPDDQRFIMVQRVEQLDSASTEINVVLNVFEELKRLVPTE